MIQHQLMAAGGDESDYDSSSSSFTAGGIDSRRSWISDVSFGSSTTWVSLRSHCSEGPLASSSYKPHKANQAEWEAIQRVRAASGRVRLDHFRILRRLGSGDLGNVYLCELRDSSSDNCLYAMKVVDKEALAFRKKIERAQTEKEILRTLDHPFLPTLYSDFDAAHYSCLVMEFCPGGDLHVLRQRQPGRRFAISSAKFYVAETLLALEYLHMMGVIYRDLKPENVLVRNDGHIMLSDFDLSFKCDDVVPKLLLLKPRNKSIAMSTKNGKGAASSSSSCVPPMQPVLSCFYGGTSKKTRRPAADHTAAASTRPNVHVAEDFAPELVAEPISARSKSFVGTHEYLAPEVITGVGHGSAVDWWTLGVFLHELVFGRTPFKGEDNEKTLINIIKQPLSFPRANSYSYTRTTTAIGRNKTSRASSKAELEEMSKAQDLISKLLVKNPRKRMGSLEGSAEIKRHEFFEGVNWALIRSVRPPEVVDDHHQINNTNTDTNTKTNTNTNTNTNNIGSGNYLRGPSSSWATNSRNLLLLRKLSGTKIKKLYSDIEPFTIPQPDRHIDYF